MDDTFKKASEDLVSAVDSREKNPMDEYDRPIDLSKKVERALELQIETIEKRGEVIVHGFPEEGPPYVALEKRFFLRELSASQEKIEKKKVVNKKLIDHLVEDIRNNFGYEADANQMEWEAFKKMIEQAPQQQADDKNFDRYKDPYQVLIDPYSYGLDEKPYGKQVLEYAFERALKNGDYGTVLCCPLFTKGAFNNYDTLKKEALSQLFKDPDSEEALRFLLRFLQTTENNQEFEEPKISGALPHRKNHTEYKDVDEFEGIPKTEVFYLCQRAVHENPTTFIRVNYGGNALKKLPQFESLIIEAYKSINLKFRLSWLDDIGVILPKETVEILAYETTQELVIDEPEELIRNYRDLSTYVNNADQFLEEAALKKPESAVYHYGSYKDSLQSGKIFRKAAKTMLESNYREAASFYNSSSGYESSTYGYPFPANYGDEVVRIGLERYPEVLLDPTMASGGLQKRPDWLTVKAAAEKKVASIGPKKKEAVDILLRSIPKNKKIEGGPARLEAVLMDDPAIALYPLVDLSWETISPDKNVKTEICIIVLRNLINQGIPFSRENFVEGYRQFWEAREKYKDTPLFEGRNILIASHSETYHDDKDLRTIPEKDRFGRIELDRGIKKRQGPEVTFEHIEPKKKSFESVKESKKRILQRIEELESPMTFIFDGHGWNDTLYLSDGNIAGTTQGVKQEPLETELTVKITVVELANALLARHRNGKDLTKDILVLNMCSSFLFIRNLYKELDKIAIPKPIAISPVEYGQYGFSSYDSTYGDDFWDTVMKSQSPNLGDFWNFKEISYQNPSVFVPTQKGDLQLAENETTEKPEKAA